MIMYWLTSMWYIYSSTFTSKVWGMCEQYVCNVVCFISTIFPYFGICMITYWLTSMWHTYRMCPQRVYIYIRCVVCA